MDYFKYIFNEDNWTIYLVEDDDNVIMSESAAAITNFDDRELYFRAGEIDKRVIKHELWHVYFGYCFLGETHNMTIEDIEEISATLFSYKCDRILEVTEDIYNKLNLLKDVYES